MAMDASAWAAAMAWVLSDALLALRAFSTAALCGDGSASGCLAAAAAAAPEETEGVMVAVAGDCAVLAGVVAAAVVAESGASILWACSDARASECDVRNKTSHRKKVMAKSC
jgi:hypothetical protein